MRDTKTPDEIKKGLEPCECMDGYNCTGCEFKYQCENKAHALAYIQQLEEALLLMVYQYCQEDDSHVSHRYMTAGEHAFAALGIENYYSIEAIEKRIDEMDGIHITPLRKTPKE